MALRWSPLPFRWLLSLGVAALLFAMIFKVLPDVKIAWSDVWTGAILTAILFNLGKLLLGLYLGRSTVTSAYGAAGSLVIILLWVYYSAQILFFGAEFTQVYTNRFGSRLEPVPGAEFLEPGATKATHKRERRPQQHPSPKHRPALS